MTGPGSHRCMRRPGQSDEMGIDFESRRRTVGTVVQDRVGEPVRVLGNGRAGHWHRARIAALEDPGASMSRKVRPLWTVRPNSRVSATIRFTVKSTQAKRSPHVPMYILASPTRVHDTRREDRMPNGGSDCCARCGFNRSLGGRRGSANFNRNIRSHCEIRDLDIPDRF